MTDGRSSASVVAIDPERAARERDAVARSLLQDDPVQALMQFMIKGLELTVPFTLKVVVSADKLESAKEVSNKILKSAWTLADTVLNNYNPDSEVSLIGKLPVGQQHTMSGPLKRVMACCQRVFYSSAGGFDPAVAPILDVLRASLKPGAPVPQEELKSLMGVCTMPNSFRIDIDAGTIARKHDMARLDLGGVSKGYIVDYVVEKHNAAGYNNVFFEWGGDCRASGTNARNTPWMVGIVRPPALEDLKNPPKDPPLIRVVTLENEAIATSGDYENLTEGPRQRLYTSIFNWHTRSLVMPSYTELAQVSVKCYSAMFADALATASLIKRDPVRVRHMLDGWRYVRDTVKDYTAYTRENERVARMFEVATESAEMRKKRIAGSLPARVIVVGGGLAGQSAAIEAANCGAQVILMEKESRLGGNSAKATSGINGWGTRAQANASIMDGGKYFERDTFKSGIGGNTDPGLVKVLSVKSADAIRWLTSLGIPLTVLSQLGGHSRKRTHRAPDMSDGTPVPIGYTIMKTLERHIRNNLSDHITIMEKTSVTALLHERRTRPDGCVQVKVNGVEITHSDGEKTRLLADAVILATGGFSNDKTPNSLLQEYAPQLSGLPTTNGPFATGDGVKLARELGVKLVDMDKVQLHPTGLIDPKDPANPTKYLGPEALRGSGGILLNKKGERFVNELDLRSVVSKAINMQGDEYPGSNDSRFAYCVLNEAAVNLFGVSSLGFYWKKLGLFVKVDTVEELAALIECPKETLRSTLVEYEETSKASRICPRTRKSVYPCVLGAQGPYYVAFVTPSIHYTMGGCLISPAAEMQMSEQPTSRFGSRRPIFGLFGAGEVTGGVHGGNRLGGNSLLECVVFGKIAGDRAAHLLYDNSSFLWHNKWLQVTLRSAVEDESGLLWLMFNLPSSFQVSGLKALQGVMVRSVKGGEPIVLLTPFTLPNEEGVVGVILNSHQVRNVSVWPRLLQPGDAVEMKAAESSESGYEVLLRAPAYVVIATSRGVAPMMQIIRSVLEKPNASKTLHLFFLADRITKIPWREELESLALSSPDRFRCTFILRYPPTQWAGGVDYADEIARSVIPGIKQSIFLCGVTEETEALTALLLDMGQSEKNIATVT